MLDTGGGSRTTAIACAVRDPQKKTKVGRQRVQRRRAPHSTSKAGRRGSGGLALLMVQYRGNARP